MDKKVVRTLIDSVRKSGRRALNAPEAQQLCDAFGLPPEAGVGQERLTLRK